MNIVIFNDELRSGMQMYLTLSNKHKVEVATDEDDLLDILKRRKIDMTFVDLQMTGRDGKLVAKISKLYPFLRVIGIYDHDQKELMQKASALGIRDFIVRPIKHRDLLKLVESSTN